MKKYGHIENEAISNISAFFKRGFDIVVSFVLLLVFLPVIGICYIAVRMEDNGPAFYTQERIGRRGETFRLTKFRSMHITAESGNTPVLCSGEDDPRLTRVGKFLRSHHLDELPQLWNVFVGHMSFVGWRPEREHFIDEILKHDHRFKYLFK